MIRLAPLTTRFLLTTTSWIAIALADRALRAEAARRRIETMRSR